MDRYRLVITISEFLKYSISDFADSENSEIRLAKFNANTLQRPFPTQMARKALLHVCNVILVITQDSTSHVSVPFANSIPSMLKETCDGASNCGTPKLIKIKIKE